MAKKDSTKFESNLQEKRIAKEVSGRTVIASGSLWGSKGDVRTEDFLIECKTTQKEFYSLTAVTWKKIRTEAIKDGIRSPVMCISLYGVEFAVADFVEFEELFDQYADTETNTASKSFMLKSHSLVGDIIFPDYHLMYCPWDDFVDYLRGE